MATLVTVPGFSSSIPYKENKNQVIQFIKGTNKVNCPKNRVERRKIEQEKAVLNKGSKIAAKLWKFMGAVH